jgi:RNA polymerase sigma-70 factor, ECF subfamily
MISLIDSPQNSLQHAPQFASQPTCDKSRAARSREIQQRASTHHLNRETREALVLQHSGRMFAVARKMLRSDEDATDAVQDAFLAAFSSLDGFRAQSRLYTWLHRIVVNACLMKLRSQKRRNAVSLDALLPTFDEHGNHATPVASWPESAAHEIEKAETHEKVRNCIDQLPDDYRTIVILRDIEELDTDETAALLGLSRVAVKTRLHRARQALRTLLEREIVCNV